MFPGTQKLRITMKQAVAHDDMYDFSIFFSAENAGKLKYIIFPGLLNEA